MTKLDQTLKANKQRESNFELLRIACILIIILSHYSVHGGFEIDRISNYFNKLFICTSGLGEIGVDCFVIISGYFLVSASFNVRKLLRLELELLSYSIGIDIIFYIYNMQFPTRDDVIFSIMPALTDKNWFLSVYMLLYMLSPFINQYIKLITKENLKKLIALLGATYIVIPTVTSYTLGGFNHISLFITFYLIGAYIRIYPEDFAFFNSIKVNVSLLAFSIIFIFGSVVFFLNKPIREHIYFMRAESIPVVVSALSLFFLFKNLPSFYNRIINKLASCTLGVYLIHDNPRMRSFIWWKLNNSEYQNSEFLVIYAICSVLLVYCGCIIIDFIRSAVFNFIGRLALKERR